MPTSTDHAPESRIRFDPDDIVAAYPAGHYDSASDERLFEIVAATLARPKAAPADSFVLHAPLELLARRALLGYVAPSAREDARRRLLWLGATYAAAGQPTRERARSDFDSTAAALGQLRSAIGAGELDDAEDAARWLAAVMTPTALSAALADEVLPRLSAAAHGNIFLYLLPRVAARSGIAAATVRGLVRELARYPDWHLSWYREPVSDLSQRGEVASADASADALAEALSAPPSPGDPGSDFIYPTMSIVDHTGFAGERLASSVRSLDAATARRVILRMAAASMLQDAPDQAPYGWSHCLTLPQAALGLAGAVGEPGDAIAVAATYVLGFRATQGRVAVDPNWIPEPPAGVDAVESLSGTPADAAAGVWHADRREHAAIVTRLATTAAVHPDAHLAKYTLACFDAADADPAARSLFLAAAAYLGAWWGARPLPGDPMPAG